MKTTNKDIEKATVLELVHRQRKKLPRIGGRKLYYLIKNDMKNKGIKCGRDKLFNYLREEKLLIKPKRRYVQTTMSKHWLRKYPNRLKGLLIEYPEQALVSDITYLKTDEGNCYLTLVTDAYSRKIMGYNIADNMTTEESVKALQMAVNNLVYLNNKIIHHSDRGLQFCSKEYVSLANENGIEMSMTEKYDPYENALAERMNRTIKEEFYLDVPLKNKEQAYNLVREAVFLYNTYRPHQALNYKTPDYVHKNP